MKSTSLFLLILLPALLSCGGAAKKNVSEESDDEIFSSYRAYDHFVKGDLFEQSGDYGAAAREYKQALIFDPKSIEIRRALSEVFFRQRNFTEAALVRSEMPERAAEDYNFIGDCLRYAGDKSGAVEFYRRSLDIDPSQLLTRTYLSRLLYQLGNLKEAEKEFKAAIDYSSDKAQAYMELASFYANTSRNGKAIEAYREAIRENPDDIRPAVGVATLYAASGDSVAADSVFRSLIEKNANNPNVLDAILPAMFSTDRIDVASEASAKIARLLPDNPDAQRRGAFLLFGTGKYTQAESAFVAIENKGMADGTTFYYHARIRQFDSDLPAARDLFEKALAENDTLSDAWINLALVTDGLDDYRGSLNLMQQAISKVPWDSTSILFYTALIHSRNEHYDLARDGYLRLLQSYPDNVDFRFNLGAAYERLGEFDKAVSEFKGIIKEVPDHALALNYVGYMYADSGINLDEALTMIRKAVSIDPENGAFLDSYAWVLYRLGRYDEALVQMKKAMEKDNSDPVLFDHQGDILAALNDLALARQSWEKALELDPGNPEIQAKLNRK